MELRQTCLRLPLPMVNSTLNILVDARISLIMPLYLLPMYSKIHGEPTLTLVAIFLLRFLCGAHQVCQFFFCGELNPELC